MSQFTTVARPYARAAFEFAVKHQNVDHWHDMLSFATKVAKNKQVKKFLFGVSSREVITKFFLAVCEEKLDQNGRNLIRIMIENDRLNILQDVLNQFTKLREEIKSTIKVKVTSAHTINKKQLLKIRNVIGKYLLRKVSIDFKIDNSLMAGIIVHSGDIVIDGSVRGRLERLANVLQS